MKNFMKKGIVFLLVVCMLMSVLSACGTTKEPEETKAPAANNDKPEETKAPETEATEPPLEQVELIFYVLGDAPADMAKVEEEMNKILLEKINATVKFEFASWTDYMNKYQLTLFSGEGVDLIYACNWMNYAGLARDGAFMALEDLIEPYMPDIAAMTTDLMWNQMKVDGTIYAVPAYYKVYSEAVFGYREDLRAKYDLPVPDSLEDIEAYLLGIQENEPDQQLLSTDLFTTASGYDFMFGPFYYLLLRDNCWDMVNYGLGYDYNTPTQLDDYWYSDQFREDMKLMKKWQELGFWSKNVLATEYEGDISTGAEVFSWGNPGQFCTDVTNTAANHPEWELGYVNSTLVNGAAAAAHPTTDCTAIAASSQNPERAAMALNLFVTDVELHNLLQFGIEGEHYLIDENGYMVDGPAYDNYPYQGANTWNLWIPDMEPVKEVDVLKNQIFAENREVASKTATPDLDLKGGFAEDTTGYAAELSALNTVCNQYLIPIQAGLVEDVDAAIDEFLAKAEEAGLAKVREGYSKQWIAYCEEMIG